MTPKPIAGIRRGSWGTCAIVGNSEDILAGFVGTDSWMGSVYISIANLLSSTMILFFVDKYGRKPLLLLSESGMGSAEIIISIAFAVWDDLGVIVVLCLVLFVVFFEIGLGPIPFFYVAELSPIKYRGEIMSYALTANWSFNALIALVTPVLVRSLHDFVFLPFGAITILGTLVIHFVFAETKHTH